MFEVRKDVLKKFSKEINKAIETYRLCLFTLPEEKLPRITPSYSLVPPSNTNTPYSSTEDIAIERADFEKEKSEFIKSFLKAVNRLGEKERQGFILRYLSEDEMFDYEVYNELNMSEWYYHQKFKPLVLYKFGIALGIIDVRAIS
ncbi:ArpU family phage packaging/lysis transcriptional regulator [Cytobacillus luteolus]|uniref:ArpU family phage packaging/lysis transcriptional regulator n=1 Tax=Litchfieldia luteola TaxID=682179 RepID=UPI001AE51986|nr:ArpU family phage packaging/lysis transcriptional regulator [Cytobacillus luteolus]MBP1944643.1 ArpU family phage transcriptional regulator [Cytobacillus luteolus]